MWTLGIGNIEQTWWWLGGRAGGCKERPGAVGIRLANNQVTCQDLLAYLLTLASKQASHEASFFPSKQVVEALLACLLVGLVCRLEV
jgi:hypothetical protein